MQVASSDVGKVFILDVSQGHTIFLGAEASFAAKLTSFISGGPTVSSSTAGAPIPFQVRVNASQSVGLLNGTLSFKVGTTVKSITILAVPLGSTINYNFCCITTPGTYNVSVSYSNDSKYSSSSTTVNNISNIGPLTVTPSQITVTSFPSSLPLFTDTNVQIQVGVPAGTGPTPSGTVTVSRSGFGPVTLTLSPSPRPNTPVGIGTFQFRAAFTERPSACFSVQYSGDTHYPATSTNLCIPVSNATTTLQIVSQSTTYTFGIAFPVTIQLTFPPELGIVNRTVHIDPVGIDLTLNPSTGAATASPNLILPFNIQQLQASYAGGGDLAASSTALSVTMNPTPTITTLSPLSSPTSNPVTLTATVACTAAISASCASLPSANWPGGTVQFFDGDLFLGQAQTVAQANGATQAILMNVSRPIGVRSFSAVFQGGSLFAPSTSPVLSVTIQ